MSSALRLLAVLALILATAYFVLAEFSFVAVKRGRLEDRAAENKRALKATEVHKQLNFMLSGAQLGIPGPLGVQIFPVPWPPGSGPSPKISPFV